MCPTVYAIAAPTPTGAKYMMILVNLNIVSARLSPKFEHGSLLALIEHRQTNAENHTKYDNRQYFGSGN